VIDDVEKKDEGDSPQRAGHDQIFIQKRAGPGIWLFRDGSFRNWRRLRRETVAAVLAKSGSLDVAPTALFADHIETSDVTSDSRTRRILKTVLREDMTRIPAQCAFANLLIVRPEIPPSLLRVYQRL
jgi:hypothetical protein